MEKRWDSISDFWAVSPDPEMEWGGGGEPESWGCGAGTGVCWGKKEIGWHYLQSMWHHLPNRPLKIEVKAWEINLGSWGDSLKLVENMQLKALWSTAEKVRIELLWGAAAACQALGCVVLSSAQGSSSRSREGQRKSCFPSQILLGVWSYRFCLYPRFPVKWEWGFFFSFFFNGAIVFFQTKPLGSGLVP